MRLHFISRLTLLLVAGFLVVASQVWPAARSNGCSSSAGW